MVVHLRATFGAMSAGPARRWPEPVDGSTRCRPCRSAKDTTSGPGSGGLPSLKRPDQGFDAQVTPCAGNLGWTRRTSHRDRRLPPGVRFAAHSPSWPTVPSTPTRWLPA